MWARWALLWSLALAGCGGTETHPTGSEVVNFYNWSDYIAEGTLAAFEAESGIEVRYDVFDSHETLEAKLLVGNSGYDLVVSGGTFFSNQRKSGVFQPLDKSRLPNLKNLDETVLAKMSVADPGGAYSVPYGWGTDGIGVNLDEVLRRLPDAPLDSWDLLFDPANASRLADCGLTLLDSPDDVVEVALIYLGKPASNDPAHLDEAFALLGAIRPYVRYFHSNQYVDDLANGEICAAFAWPSDVLLASQRAAGTLRLHAFVPKEGSQIWVEHLAIPADAPHPHNAHVLMNYLMRPDVAAAFTNATYYASGNRAAAPLVSPAIRGNSSVHPGGEMMERLHLVTEHSPAYLRKRTRLWTELKSGL